MTRFSSLQFHTAVAAMALTGALASGSAAAADPTVIELTQTNCQFVEPENGKDHGYASTRKEDCVAINDRTADERLAGSQTIELEPGKYVFRVTNQNVAYPLGFWLRGDGLVGRATLPSVSGGGLVTGGTKDYEIELVAGEYVFSCPLNNTPDYRLVVKG